MCKKYFKLLKEAVSTTAKRVMVSTGDLKQVYIVRTDLDMGKGKIAAQCCHAAVKSYRDLLACGSEVSAMVARWELRGSRKVVVKVGSQAELSSLISNAKQHGLYGTTITDAGKTQIPLGSMTVGVIGPGDERLIDEISGHLKLL